MGAVDVILALAKVFIMILPGFILTRLDLLKPPHTEGISNIITNLTYPFMVINAMQMEFSLAILNNCKYVVLIFTAVVLVAMLISKLLTSIIKIPVSQSGIMAFMMVFGSTGFLGLPVLDGLYGKEAVFYGALADSSFNILMFTIGIILIKQAAAGENKLGALETIKGLLNPCFIGALIGLALYVCKISLPDVIGGPVETIGAATSPLAMMVVGSHLARVGFKDMFLCKTAYLVCLLKLLVNPAIALIGVMLIIGSGTLFGTVIVIEAAMPCALLSVILSERYKADVEFATKGTMLTTFLCLITIPLVAITLQHI
ncbi:MAG: AEC family transporter [Eubacteriales bacterium]|nr:AEC family transporter [Eubacteriales bacterium]